MKRNIGDIDANIRIMIGFFLAYWYFITLHPTQLQTAGVIIAVLLMVSAVVGNCPFYRLLHITTCKKGGCDASLKKDESEEKNR